MQYRLDHAIDEKLVAEDAVEVEQVEEQQTSLQVEALVVEHHRDVVGRERGKPEPRGLVARVERVEEQIKACQALVHVLSGKVYPVVVIPQRAHCLIDIATLGDGEV